MPGSAWGPGHVTTAENVHMQMEHGLPGLGAVIENNSKMSRQPGGNRQISLVASLVESLFSRRGVITSYSIHYTKLYDGIPVGDLEAKGVAVRAGE